MALYVPELLDTFLVSLFVYWFYMHLDLVMVRLWSHFKVGRLLEGGVH